MRCNEIVFTWGSIGCLGQFVCTDASDIIKLLARSFEDAVIDQRLFALVAGGFKMVLMSEPMMMSNTGVGRHR